MAKILYIEASPRKERSSSIEVAHTFLQEYKNSHPNDEIVTLDLWEKQLPAMNEEAVNARFSIMRQGEPTESQKKIWHSIEEVIAQFTCADKYIFSIPMWNFGIPYVLKHYLDVIMQPGYTFSFSEEKGFEGLIKNKKALIILARGGSYPQHSPTASFDMQKKYMELALGFMGLTTLESLIVEPTMQGPQLKKEVLASANAKAKLLAQTF